MARRVSIIFLILILSLVTFAESFSDFPWQAGIDEVKEAEGLEPQLEASSFLLYEVSLFNKKTQKIYSFNDNQLVSVIYIFNELPSELKGFLYDYEAVNSELESLLGAPLSIDERWEDERFSAFPELALALGDLSFTSIWISGIDSLLTHSLYAEDLSITHVIFINSLAEIFVDVELESESVELLEEEAVGGETEEIAVEESLLEEEVVVEEAILKEETDVEEALDEPVLTE